MSRTPRRGLTLLDVAVVLVILVVLFALLMPGLGTHHRPAARRSQCRNNLKQIGLALHNYHDIFNAFPPGWVAVPSENKDAPPEGAYGWGVRILPFMDQKPMYDMIDFERPFASDDASKEVVSTSRLETYQCPSDGGPTNAADSRSRSRSDAPASVGQTGHSLTPNMATSNYIGNFGVGLPTAFGKEFEPKDVTRQGLFGCNSNVTIAHVVDGSSNTVFVSERRLPLDNGSDWPQHGVEGRFNSYWPGIPRMGTVSPLSIVGTATSGVAGEGALSSLKLNDLLASEEPLGVVVFAINRTADGELLEDSQRVSPGFSSRHTQGTHALLVDGSVKFLNENLNTRTLINLSRMMDGLDVGEF